MKRVFTQMQTFSFVKKVVAVSALSVIMLSCKKDDYDDDGGTAPQGASVVSVAGDSATIIGSINVFRSLLGDSLNVTPGKTSGRREVNWDAVPATFTNADNFPADFFNSTVATDPAGRKKGLLMLASGTAFRVDTTSYAGIEPSYSSAFEVFSKKRLFTTIGSNITNVAFKVPGTSTDAFVKGFGVVFCDVDSDNSTTLEFFNGNTSLGVFKAAKHPAQGNFSFLGVHFKNGKVTRIRITSGNGSLAKGVKDISNGGSKDLVVMDDFFYNEPAAINQ